MTIYHKLFLFSSVIAVTSGCAGSYQIPSDLGTDPISNTISYLADDALKGRPVGSAEEKMAANFLSDQFKAMGLAPKGDDGSYLQAYTAYDSSNPHATGDEKSAGATEINTQNVVAFYDNNAPYTVIIGAHYDHLGMGSFGSLHNGPAAIHNGADDNASGVSVMMYLAEKLKTSKFKHNNYLFIAFSGEEKGLWGSNYWTKHPTYPLEKVNYMINLDMVGRMKDNKLAINGTGTSPAWSVLDEVNTKKYELVKTESGIGPSDHTSFYLKDLPVIHFFTGQHEDYHKPGDDTEKINIEGCYEVAFFILNVVDALDGDKIAFTKTKDDSPERRSFKVTLGVIPDYMFQDGGMRIDGVKEGRPAANAGIENGDVVIKMGDLEVSDMKSYMESLSKFNPGQTVPVTIMRREEKLVKHVTF